MAPIVVEEGEEGDEDEAEASALELPPKNKRQKRAKYQPPSTAEAPIADSKWSCSQWSTNGCKAAGTATAELEAAIASGKVTLGDVTKFTAGMSKAEAWWVSNPNHNPNPDPDPDPDHDPDPDPDPDADPDPGIDSDRTASLIAQGNLAMCPPNGP